MHNRYDTPKPAVDLCQGLVLETPHVELRTRKVEARCHCVPVVQITISTESVADSAVNLEVKAGQRGS